MVRSLFALAAWLAVADVVSAFVPPSSSSSLSSVAMMHSTQLGSRRTGTLRMVATPIYSNATQFTNGVTDPAILGGGETVADVLKQKEQQVGTVSVEHGRNTYMGDPSSFNNKLGMYQIKCFNKISAKGLARFDEAKYDVRLEGEDAPYAHAVLLRSHKMQETDVPKTCRAIARAGAGVNNIPVDRMTELGVPVFNTPGANANAVKELVFCGMLLASRGIVQGIQHMRNLGTEAKNRVEKDKAMFAGREVQQKTLAIIGLGHIGTMLARDAHAGLNMNIVGYDPYLSVDNAMQLPKEAILAKTLEDAVANADFISIHTPYMESTHGIIDAELLKSFQDDAVLLNFARGELVDSQAIKDHLDANPHARYVSDFPDDNLYDHEQVLILPHLGASTSEAEDCAAGMAADTLKDYLQDGTIRNSVNFPEVTLPNRKPNTLRFTVISRDAPGVLGHLFDVFGQANLNILQEISRMRGDISYTVMDVDTTGHSHIEFKGVQEKVTMLPGVLSSRVLYGMPGAGYAKNLEGEYWV